MKKTLFVLLILSLTIFSCKSKKAVSGYTPDATPIEQSATIETVEAAEPVDETPIMIKTEEVSVADNEDKTKEGYAFYVIIGSFSVPENAAKFKEQIIAKGFNPVLLNSETGFVRVAVDQSNFEKDARSVVMNIRNDFPEYKDVWLLKKK